MFLDKLKTRTNTKMNEKSKYLFANITSLLNFVTKKKTVRIRRFVCYEKANEREMIA